MSVAKRFFARGMRHVISLSLMPIGDSGMRCSSLDFTSKPTPWLRREPSGTPFQKKVYPAPASVKESSPCSLVSLRAAMSMLYLASSRATSAVLRWGLSGVSARSSSVRTFHEAMLSLFFTLIFQQFFDHLFQVIPHHRGEQCGAAQSQWKGGEGSKNLAHRCKD